MARNRADNQQRGGFDIGGILRDVPEIGEEAEVRVDLRRRPDAGQEERRQRENCARRHGLAN